MSKLTDIDKIIATNPEMREKALSSLRKDLGIKEIPVNPESPDSRIVRIKCSDASFFPNPPSYWTPSNPLMYQLISSDYDSYIKAWTYKGIRVLASVSLYDGVEWLHISFSRQNRIPSYDEIQLVRDNFIGTDKKSIMVFPSEDHYVNIHKHCLHLWYSPSNPVPDFDIDLPTIGKSI